MGRKLILRPTIPIPTSTSGEFPKARPISEPIEKYAIGQPALVLDMREFGGEEEPPTEKIKYIESIDQLRNMLRGAIAFERNGQFDPAAFAEKLVCMEMCTTEKDSPNPFYYIEDSYGNQFRLYIDPKGKIESKRIDQDRRVVIGFSDQTGHLFPIIFPKDNRREE